MRVEDIVYGGFEITEPSAVELIGCSAMQRLKGVDQIGYSRSFFPGTSHSRFEHSLGVYHLLRAYGAGVEEQIAGLIHDVSHSAFSHCIDFVMDAGSGDNQSYQDDIMDEFIVKTEIPGILARHGYRLQDVLDDSRHKLKERPLPELCADRIDYSLRTGMYFGYLDRSKAQEFLGKLNVVGSRWVFDGFECAKRYALLFKKQNDENYAGFKSAVMFRTVADYLRRALDKGYIEKSGLYTGDDEVINRINLKLDSDPKLRLFWERMNNRVRFRNDPADYEERISTKSRVVDPLCIQDGMVMRVSDIDDGWKQVVADESRPKEYFIRFAR